MRSFALTAFATLAFGFFCSAAPTPDSSADANVSRDLVDTDFTLDVLALMGVDADVHIRSAAPTLNDGADVNLSRRLLDAQLRSVPANHKCLDGIVTPLIEEIAAIVDEITDLEVVVTVEVLIPILAKVKAILKLAIGGLKALEGLDVQAILKSVVGLALDVNGVAKLICAVIEIVIKLIQCVHGRVSLDNKDEILAVLLEIVGLLCELLSCVRSLVGGVLGGLTAVVVSLLGGAVIKVIIDLKLTVLIKVLYV